jgi:hypothetical protein
MSVSKDSFSCKLSVFMNAAKTIDEEGQNFPIYTTTIIQQKNPALINCPSSTIVS